MALPCIELTHHGKETKFYLPADRIARIEADNQSGGALIFTDDANRHPFHVSETAVQVANMVGNTIAWRESRVIEAQLAAQQRLQNASLAASLRNGG